jgi:hypothetical protein
MYIISCIYSVGQSTQFSYAVVDALSTADTPTQLLVLIVVADAGLSGSGLITVRVFEEEGDCIVCLEIRADELIRHLISGELANYRVVRTSPKPLHSRTAKCLLLCTG